jgi:uncharacterized protein with NAD-binding domain and iron-sulfur cluster
MEAGVRGFWKDYPNTVSLVAELGLREGDVFTPYTTSAFYSPDGLEATAPVFSTAEVQLPSPLGQVAASMQLFKRLPLADRASMAGLLLAMLDYERDAETWAAYDRMSAHDLFLRCGLSQRLVDDFLRPTLAVGLFAPLELLSAAVTMELLYFYALAHQDSFDVRWIRSRSIAELLINPLAAQLTANHGLRVLSSSRCTGLDVDADGNVTTVRYTDAAGNAQAIADAEAVVLAVGATGLRAVLAGSPGLAAASPELGAAASLGSIDVISVRLWLDIRVAVQNPANVFARFPELRGAGGTFFMLDQLQAPGGDPDGLRRLWAAGEDADADALGSVVAADFYFAGALMALSDASLVALLMDRLLPAAVPGFAAARVTDSAVLRGRDAVSWFTPGSGGRRPPLRPVGAPNLACAGDWVRLGAREHGAKGLCQERAYVTGLEAANSLLRDGPLRGKASKQHAVLPVRPDEPQVLAGRAAAKAAGELAAALGLQPPWLR